MSLASVVLLSTGLWCVGAAMAAPCETSRFPAIDRGSMRFDLMLMSVADSFDLNWWVDGDALVDRPASSSREWVDALSRRFNVVVQYRIDPTCKALRLDRVWVLPVGETVAAKAPPPVPTPTTPPDPAVEMYLRGHGGPAAGKQSTGH